MDKALLNVQGFEAQDFVRVPYPPLLASLVLVAKAAWEEFYALPGDLKRSFGYQPDVLVSGVGYQGPETGRDPKEHFHLRLSEASWLSEQAERLDHPVVTKFIEIGLSLCEQLKPFARDFVEAGESQFPVPGLLQDTMALEQNWTVRFLHYTGGCEPGDVIAAEHLDKGAFTAHLYESDGGFERLTREGTWEEVRFGNGETAIIAGARLQARSEGRLVAVCHRVVANERTARSGRDSIVCFFDILNAPYYDKAQWGPMQERTVGFNYPPAPFSEFIKYFTDTSQ